MASNINTLSFKNGAHVVDLLTPQSAVGAVGNESGGGSGNVRRPVAARELIEIEDDDDEEDENDEEVYTSAGMETKSEDESAGRPLTPQKNPSVNCVDLFTPPSHPIQPIAAREAAPGRLLQAPAHLVDLVSPEDADHRALEDVGVAAPPVVDRDPPAQAVLALRAVAEVPAGRDVDVHGVRVTGTVPRAAQDDPGVPNGQASAGSGAHMYTQNNTANFNNYMYHHTHNNYATYNFFNHPPAPQNWCNHPHLTRKVAGRRAKFPNRLYERCERCGYFKYL